MSKSPAKTIPTRSAPKSRPSEPPHIPHNARPKGLSPNVVRKLTLWTVAAGVVVIAAVFAVLQFTGQKLPTATLQLGSGPKQAAYSLEIVTDEAAQVKGLSGRSGLGKNAGILFQYEVELPRCIWMKDMLFDIDVVWLDADRRVTSTAPNLTPQTYPQTYCAPALYVIELNAGEITAHNIRPGQKLELTL